MAKGSRNNWKSLSPTLQHSAFLSISTLIFVINGGGCCFDNLFPITLSVFFSNKMLDQEAPLPQRAQRVHRA